MGLDNANIFYESHNCFYVTVCSMYEYFPYYPLSNLEDGITLLDQQNVVPVASGPWWLRTQ